MISTAYSRIAAVVLGACVLVTGLSFPALSQTLDDGIAAEAPFRQLIDTEFRAEVVDSGWSADTESFIRENVFENRESHLSDALAGTSSTSIACRSTMCKIETTHVSLHSFRQFMASLDQSLEWSHQSHFFLASSDPFVAITYVSREGTTLTQRGLADETP